jgi:hypothetical protein
LSLLRVYAFVWFSGLIMNVLRRSNVYLLFSAGFLVISTSCSLHVDYNDATDFDALESFRDSPVVPAAGNPAVPSTPSGLTLVTPSSSPGNVTTPVIRVSGVTSGDMITIHTSDTCTLISAKGQGIAPGATVDLTSSALPEGSFTFYAKATDAFGNGSTCSSVSVGYTLDVVVPEVTEVAVESGLTVDVTFSEVMSAGVGTAANYSLSGSGRGSLASTPTSVALVSGKTYRLTWASGEMYNGGDITIAVSTAQDTAGNAVDSSGTHVGGGIGTPPEVISILRTTTSPSDLTTLAFDVTFSKPVTDVGTNDFTITTTGVSGASVSGVTGAGSNYVVSVNSGSGDGTVGLNLVDDDSIVDLAGHTLNGVSDGGYYSGQVYIVQKGVPSIQSIAPRGGKSAGGNTVVIGGNDFYAESLVKIHGTNCTTTTFVSSTQLDCDVPSNAAGTTVVTAGDITVLNPNGRSDTSTQGYVYLGDPLIWLDGADATTITTASGAVSQWNNKGSGADATQSTAAARPLLSRADNLGNLILRSEEFESTWTTTNTAVTANSTTAPDSTASADRISDDGTNGVHSLSQNFNMFSGVQYAVSVRVKSGTLSQLKVNLPSPTNLSATCDLSNGTVSNDGAGAGYIDASISSIGSGWYVCSLNYTAQSNASQAVEFRTVSAGGFDTYTGSSDYLYLWGAHVRELSWSSTYLVSSAILQYPGLNGSNWLFFDGTDDKMVANSGVPYTSSEFSMAIMGQFKKGGTHGILLPNGGRSGFIGDASGKIQARAYTTFDTYVTSTTVLTSAGPFSGVLVYDNAQSVNKCSLDINGVNEANGVFFPSLLNITTTSIGENASTIADSFFHGALGEAFVFLKALNSSERSAVARYMSIKWGIN